MNIVKESFEILDEGLSPSKKIEKIARICYKSEDKICEGSDIKLIRDVLLARKHYAMLEHADFCFGITWNYYRTVDYVIKFLQQGFPRTLGFPIELRLTNMDTQCLISGNVRAWLEFFALSNMLTAKNQPYMKGYFEDGNDGDIYFKPFVKAVKSYINNKFKGILWDDVPSGYSIEDIVPISDWSVIPTAACKVHQTMSVVFTVDRGVTHELVRMRKASFAQESTRYCNYGKGKFGNEITVVDLENHVVNGKDTGAYDVWLETLRGAEDGYLQLVNCYNVPAQIARGVLPQNTKSTICVTANMLEWIHIFELRALDATGPAHPQMKEVMVPLLEEARKRYDVFSSLGNTGIVSVIM